MSVRSGSLALLTFACAGSPETRDSGEALGPPPTEWNHAATEPGVGVEPPGSTWPADTFDCIETELPYDAKLSPVTPEEVWTAMAAYAPSTVTWTHGEDHLPPGSSGTSTVDIGFFPAGEVSLVTRVYTDQPSAPCRPGPDLRIPVSVETLIAEGELIGTLSGYLEAAGPDFRDLYFTRIETKAAAFSPEWLADAQDNYFYDEDLTVLVLGLVYWGSRKPEVRVAGEWGESSWFLVWDGTIE